MYIIFNENQIGWPSIVRYVLRGEKTTVAHETEGIRIHYAGDVLPRQEHMRYSV